MSEQAPTGARAHRPAGPLGAPSIRVLWPVPGTDQRHAVTEIAMDATGVLYTRQPERDTAWREAAPHRHPGDPDDQPDPEHDALMAACRTILAAFYHPHAQEA